MSASYARSSSSNAVNQSSSIKAIKNQLKQAKQEKLDLEDKLEEAKEQSAILNEMNAHMNLFINIANSLPESLQTNFKEQDSLCIPGLKDQESTDLIKQTVLHKDLKIQSVSEFFSGLKSREYLMQQLSRNLNNILPRTALSNALLEAYEKSFTKTVASCV